NHVIAGQQVVIGKMPQELARYGFQPPYGTNLVIAIATRAPLFDEPLSKVSELTQFLPKLTRALQAQPDARLASPTPAAAPPPRLRHGGGRALAGRALTIPPHVPLTTLRYCAKPRGCVRPAEAGGGVCRAVETEFALSAAHAAARPARPHAADRRAEPRARPG